MPIENQILGPHPIAYRRFHGRITMAELAASSEALHADPGYTPGTPTVVDMLEVEGFDIGFDEMQRFATLTQERHTTRGEDAEICIVCTSDQGSFLAEMFRSLADIQEGMVTIHILHGFPEVLATLDLPPELINQFPPHCREESHLL